MATYYVSTTGNDSSDGSIGTPWLTWNKAFTSTSVNAGDTVYFRGGIYYITVINGTGLVPTRTGNGCGI